MASDTGQGATITFGTSAFSVNMKSIGGTEQSREKLEDTHLGSSDFKEYIADDLVDPGEFTIEYFWSLASTAIFPPISSAAETITVTMPTGETLTGTGFMTRAKGPDMRIGEIMMGEATIAWDGKTGPTYST